jgi:BlaI family penicillinase repressor
MKQFKLADGEYKFVSLIWESEPINSTALVKLSLEQLGWKKATTYTVLRKLCEKGILSNENATVTSLVKKEEIQKFESEVLLEKNFGNSLPAFLAAFLKDKKLSKKEAEEIREMIEKASR